MHDARTEEPRSEVSRREFIRLAGASIALAGLDGCARMPAEHILPYVDNRPELTPGVGSYYATAMPLDGFATGLIVEAHDGRPTKIEGNPAHPASLGATGPIEQASLLQLYDPDRARYARVGQARTTWQTIAAQLTPTALQPRVGARGGGLHILIEPTSSVLDEELLARVLASHPDARIYMYGPLAGTRADSPTVEQYDFSTADTILAIDSDFLASGPFHLRYARQFADNRRLAQPTDAMNRLYVVESTFTPTGAAADHRFAVRPSEIRGVLQALSLALSSGNATGAPTWIQAVAKDLRAHAGRSVVVVGTHQPADVRALGNAINSALGASERLAWHTPSPLVGRTIPVHSITELVAAMRARTVDTLIIVGGNPSYTTPASLEFSTLTRVVRNSGYLGLYENETARDVRWFVPMSHYLEAWGDVRAHDGTLSIVQPLINPLYGSVAAAELYAALGGHGVANAYDLLRASWTGRVTGDAEAAWADALQRGLAQGSEFPHAAASAVIPAVPTPEQPANRDSIEVVYLHDPKVHDGAFANNGWLQELPAPLTQLTWGNAALLSPVTARNVGIQDGTHVTLTSQSRHIELPALIVPGHADNTVSITFGYGRTGAESLARGVGVNAYALWPDVSVRAESGVAIGAASASSVLALEQPQSTMKVQEPLRRATLAEYRASPSSVGTRPGRVLSLYPERPPSPQAANQWAMTIDLGTCIGCGGCVVACQAENNVPVVGADDVRKGRAMHWLRIDRYFAEREREVEALLQPMLCQHCEKAPCEYVCPVGATTHSADGLNEMIYNRCVGTRFCSNNCPYKVRRFNWFDYSKLLSDTESMAKNPNVTVRERGVMEKCTFCVQRIREAEIAATRENRPVRGMDVRTACQQACPTNAIVFGSLTEPDSEVVRRRQQPRSYAALEDLGTEPRVRYLARVRNTNSDIAGPT